MSRKPIATRGVLSPLAAATYAILRQCAGKGATRITYAQLSRRLHDKDDAFEHVHHRSQALYAALCEVGGDRCSFSAASAPVREI